MSTTTSANACGCLLLTGTSKRARSLTNRNLSESDRFISFDCAIYLLAFIVVSVYCLFFVASSEVGDCSILSSFRIVAASKSVLALWCGRGLRVCSVFACFNGRFRKQSRYSYRISVCRVVSWLIAWLNWCSRLLLLVGTPHMKRSCSTFS